jgi:hypothetical protein
MRLTNWLYIWVLEVMARWHAEVVAQCAEVMGMTSPLRVRGVPVGMKPLGSIGIVETGPVQPVNVVVLPPVEDVLELDELVVVLPAVPVVPVDPPPLQPRVLVSATMPQATWTKRMPNV